MGGASGNASSFKLQAFKLLGGRAESRGLWNASYHRLSCFYGRCQFMVQSSHSRPPTAIFNAVDAVVCPHPAAVDRGCPPYCLSKEPCLSMKHVRRKDESS